MSHNWKIDLRPFEFMDARIDNVVKTDPNDKNKKIVSLETVEKNEVYSSKNIKLDLADILGNSGRSPLPQFFVSGSEKHKRNNLGDVIVKHDKEDLILSIEEYNMLLQATDEVGGRLPRKYKEILNRIYNAEKIDLRKES